MSGLQSKQQNACVRRHKQSRNLVHTRLLLSDAPLHQGNHTRHNGRQWDEPHAGKRAGLPARRDITVGPQGGHFRSKLEPRRHAAGCRNSRLHRGVRHPQDEHTRGNATTKRFALKATPYQARAARTMSE